MAKKQEIGFFGSLLRIFMDNCPKCKSLNVTKVKLSEFKASGGVVHKNFQFTCQDCGYKWKDTKKVKVEVEGGV